MPRAEPVMSVIFPVHLAAFAALRSVSENHGALITIRGRPVASDKDTLSSYQGEIQKLPPAAGMSMHRLRPALLRMMILNIAAILTFSATGESTALLQVTHGAELPYTQTRLREEVPLRFYEPFEIVVADLEDYIPPRLREADVPGLAIALIHNKRVVWSAGFVFPA